MLYSQYLENETMIDYLEGEHLHRLAFAICIKENVGETLQVAGSECIEPSQAETLRQCRFTVMVSGALDDGFEFLQERGSIMGRTANSWPGSGLTIARIIKYC